MKTLLTKTPQKQNRSSKRGLGWLVLAIVGIGIVAVLTMQTPVRSGSLDAARNSGVQQADCDPLGSGTGTGNPGAQKTRQDGSTEPERMNRPERIAVDPAPVEPPDPIGPNSDLGSGTGTGNPRPRSFRLTAPGASRCV